MPEKSKDSVGGLWQFVGLLPLVDQSRHDSAEAIREALNLGINIKIITGKLITHSLCFAKSYLINFLN